MHGALGPSLEFRHRRSPRSHTPDPTDATTLGGNHSVQSSPKTPEHTRAAGRATHDAPEAANIHQPMSNQSRAGYTCKRPHTAKRAGKGVGRWRESVSHQLRLLGSRAISHTTSPRSRPKTRSSWMLMSRAAGFAIGRSSGFTLTRATHVRPHPHHRHRPAAGAVWREGLGVCETGSRRTYLPTHTRQRGQGGPKAPPAARRRVRGDAFRPRSLGRVCPAKA